MEFKAVKNKDGALEVKAIVEKDLEGNVKINLPSLSVIQKVIKDEQLKQTMAEEFI